MPLHSRFAAAAAGAARREPARRVFVCVGEQSGDIAGAQLVTELRRQNPDVYVFGSGGRRMAEAGADIDVDTNDIGVVGVTETLGIIPSVIRAGSSIRRRVRRLAPDVAVLIGNDIFNSVLARWLRRQGVPTVSYFPPQVWIWRSLARPIARGFDAILASFPDEYDVYARVRERTEVTYVGHYLAAALQPATPEDRRAARSALGLAPDATVVALLPGSRRQELRALGSVLLGAAERLLAGRSDLRFVIPVLDGEAAEAMQQTVDGYAIAARTTLCRSSHVAMRSADLAVMASGTASLEAALIGVPMIVVYKVSALTNLIVRAAIAARLIDSCTVSLPNLIAKRRIVPELLQRNATVDSVAGAAAGLLADPAKLARIRLEYRAIAAHLAGAHPLTDVAAAVLQWADTGRRRSIARARGNAIAAHRRPIGAQESE
jgi:lipid-A-disaccharide synthase